MTITLPDAGGRRYWEIKHQPNKKSTPLRLELRERTNQNSRRVLNSFSRLIAFDDTVAAEAAVIETAERILERAGKVDEFIGIHITNNESEVA